MISENPRSGAINFVIVALNDIIRKDNAAAAGLTRFKPIPPKHCLTITMAKKFARAISETGAVTGIQKAIITPVTMQDRSSTDGSLPIISLEIYSKPRAKRKSKSKILFS